MAGGKQSISIKHPQVTVLGNSEDLNNKDIARQGEVGMTGKQKRARYHYDVKLIPPSETCVRHNTT